METTSDSPLPTRPIQYSACFICGDPIRRATIPPLIWVHNDMGGLRDHVAIPDVDLHATQAAEIERARILAQVEALEPLLDVHRLDGGYDCCGCSTLNKLHEDVLAIIRGES